MRILKSTVNTTSRQSFKEQHKEYEDSIGILRKRPHFLDHHLNIRHYPSRTR